MRSISFISANYVARALNYPGGTIANWDQFDAATVGASPEPQFPAVAADAADAGFHNIDVWTAHCHWQKHGPAAADQVKGICAAHKLGITSYIGSFEAKKPQDVEAVFAFMKRLGAPMITGNIWGLSDEQLPAMVDEVGQRLGVEMGL